MSKFNEVEVGDIIGEEVMAHVRVMTLERGEHSARWTGIVVSTHMPAWTQTGNSVPVTLVAKTRGTDTTEGNRHDAMVLADLLDDIEQLAVRAEQLVASTRSGYVEVSAKSLAVELRAVIEPYQEED